MHLLIRTQDRQILGISCLYTVNLSCDLSVAELPSFLVFVEVFKRQPSINALCFRVLSCPVCYDIVCGEVLSCRIVESIHWSVRRRRQPSYSWRSSLGTSRQLTESLADELMNGKNAQKVPYGPCDVF